jgi:hypothetical protein
MFSRASVVRLSTLIRRTDATNPSVHAQLLRRFYRPWINRAPLKVKLPDGTVFDRREEARKASVRDKGKDPVFAQLHDQLADEDTVVREAARTGKRARRGKIPLVAESIEDVDFSKEASLGVEKVMPMFEFTKLAEDDPIFRLV